MLFDMWAGECKWATRRVHVLNLVKVITDINHGRTVWEASKLMRSEDVLLEFMSYVAGIFNAERGCVFCRSQCVRE